MKPTKALADLLTALSDHDQARAVSALETLSECMQGLVTYWPNVPAAIKTSIPTAHRYALMSMLLTDADETDPE